MSKKAVAAGVALLLILGWLLLPEGATRPGGQSGGEGHPSPSIVPMARKQEASEPLAPKAQPPDKEVAPNPTVPARSLSVSVCDEAGGGVSGATVRCLAGSDATPFSADFVADAAGNVSVEVPAEVPCRLLATAKGFADTESNVRPEHDRVLILMKGAHFLEGRVFDKATGKAVPGARVRVLAGSEWNANGRFWDATTAADGSFRREGLPPGKFLVGAGLKAWAGDWDYDEARVGPIAADTHDLRVELVAGPVLSGIVLDDTGQPFCGPFNVSARTIVVGRTDADYLMQYGPSEGGEAGRFRLRHVEPGAYHLTVYPTPAEGVSPPFAPAILRWVVQGSEGLEVRLVQGLPIEGQAVDGDGKPVEVAGIFRVFGPEGDVPLALSRGDGREGRFTTGPLDPRFEYDILLCSPFADGRRQTWALLKRVRPGARDLKVVMKPPAPIAGVLLKSSGEPVGSGVPVTAQCQEYRFWLIGMAVTGYTNADGSFSIPGIGPPGDLRFRLCAGGGKSGLQPVVVEGPFQGGQEGIEIRLPSTGETVEGTVRLSKGVTGKGLRVRFTAVPSSNGELGSPWYVESTTDEAGRFRGEGLPSGMVALWVTVEGKEYFCGTFEAPSTGVEATVPLK